MSSQDYTEMQVHKLVMDPNTNSPIVILQDAVSGDLLPIWIGIFEAHAIAMKLEKEDSPRPMTHDLLSETFTTIKALVNRVAVTDLVEGTYFARIYFSLNGEEHSLDSRPSDAIAVALRTRTPIYVANAVLEQSKIVPEQLVEADSDDDVPEEEPGDFTLDLGAQDDLASSASAELPKSVEPVDSEDEALRLLRSLKPPKDPSKFN